MALSGISEIPTEMWAVNLVVLGKWAVVLCVSCTIPHEIRFWRWGGGVVEGRLCNNLCVESTLENVLQSTGDVSSIEILLFLINNKLLGL